MTLLATTPPAVRHRLAWCAVLTLSLLVATGLTWMLVDARIDPADFESTWRTWRHRLLVSHGLLAYLALWLAGSLLPHHQITGWRLRHRRASGGVLTVSLLGLSATALGLYYPPGDAARELFAWVHQALGLALVPAVAWHLASAKDRSLQRG